MNSFHIYEVFYSFYAVSFAFCLCSSAGESFFILPSYSRSIPSFSLASGRSLECGGGVIINLQQTQYDSLCCMRIFQKIDIVMTLLLNELEVRVECRIGCGGLFFF
jgi:hypothetical protein